jgi:hypothetical protein
METALGALLVVVLVLILLRLVGVKGGPFSSTGEPGAAGATDALLWSRPGVFAISGEKDLPKKF